jgi:hypothetical protein
MAWYCPAFFNLEGLFLKTLWASLKGREFRIENLGIYLGGILKLSYVIYGCPLCNTFLHKNSQYSKKKKFRYNFMDF